MQVQSNYPSRSENLEIGLVADGSLFAAFPKPVWCLSNSAPTRIIKAIHGSSGVASTFLTPNGLDSLHWKDRIG